MIDEIGYHVEYEDLFDAYARRAFRGGFYLHALHCEILMPVRRTRSDDVWDHLKGLLDRYERLRSRWCGRDDISDMTLCLLARASASGGGPRGDGQVWRIFVGLNVAL